MTYEEATKQFLPFLERDDVYADKYIAAIKTAISAMNKMSEYEQLKERDTAKKVIKSTGEYSIYRFAVWSCPKCKQRLDSVNFCPACGQRVDYDW